MPRLTRHTHRMDFDLEAGDLAAWLAHVGIRELEKYLARHAAFDAFLRERGLA